MHQQVEFETNKESPRRGRESNDDDNWIPKWKNSDLPLTTSRVTATMKKSRKGR